MVFGDSYLEILIFRTFQSFSEPDFQGQEGFSKVQNLVDVLLQIMLEKEGFKVML